jgi:nicotinate-nucleotide pyrophosphorylase (carboxylating)
VTDTDFIRAALAEDIGPGDYSTLAAIEPQAAGKAILKVKEDGILAGMGLAEKIVHFLEPEAQFRHFRTDGDRVTAGEIAFELDARVHTLLQAERLLLNCAQRMSGIATLTSQYVARIKDYKAKVLDTRKTTPLFRKYEKQAVAIGGGVNHRMGLYDMVMLKDNHIDFCGGIAKALQKTRTYLEQNNLPLKIEIETRSLDDVRQVLDAGGADRIMLDNYAPEQVAEAVQLISGSAETEASGGIHLDNIVAYAQAGVDFISVGAIIHHAVSLDLSLKAQLA